MLRVKYFMFFCLFMHVLGLADIDHNIHKVSVNALVHVWGFFLAAL